MSTGEVPVVKSKLPIRLTLRHATGEMPLRISMAFWSLAASLCSYTRDSSGCCCLSAHVISLHLSRNYSKFGALLRGSFKIKAERVIMNCNLGRG